MNKTCSSLTLLYDRIRDPLPSGFGMKGLSLTAQLSDDRHVVKRPGYLIMM